MSKIKEGVHWCARDMTGLAVLGNHHFILLVARKENFQEIPFDPKSENGIYFCTLGGFINRDDRLVFHVNNKYDVKATREHIDPDEHVQWNKPDFDFESHRVSPPRGTHLGFIADSARLARNYERNTENNAPKYSLIDENCAAWVNTLFAVAGISTDDRDEYGEFFGIDWGEEDLLDEALFAD